MHETQFNVQHNAAQQRFEYTADDQLCVAEYRMSNGIMLLTHTVVPDALQGRGIASALAQAAMTFAQNEGLKVDPVCSYMRVYMERHPDTQTLLA